VVACTLPSWMSVCVHDDSAHEPHHCNGIVPTMWALAVAVVIVTLSSPICASAEDAQGSTSHDAPAGRFELLAYEPLANTSPVVLTKNARFTVLTSRVCTCASVVARITHSSH
jgi:hypothetical protein